MTPTLIGDGGLTPVPQSPSPANDLPTPATATQGGGAAAPQRSAPPTVSVTLTSVDPPVVAEYAELTPGSTGPLVTALSESGLMAELKAHRAFSARAEVAAEGAEAPARFDEIA